MALCIPRPPSATHSLPLGPSEFLGSLPRRRVSSGARKSVLHFTGDDHSAIDDWRPLKLKKNNTLRISLDTENVPPVFKQTRTHRQYNPHLQILIPLPSSLLPKSNPTLKSALKWSPSPNSKRPVHSHDIAPSSTPNVDFLSSTTSTLTSSKSVRFADDGNLVTVRPFFRTASPASISNSNAIEDTETESESPQPFSCYIRNSLLPLPRITPAHASGTRFDLDRTDSSPVPALCPPANANVHLESISLSPCASALTGAVVVRNLAYEKHVAVRFTLDNWKTTNEVFARHLMSIPCLPAQLLPQTGAMPWTNDGREQMRWDRFAFTIRLEDYASKLNEYNLHLAARFTPGNGGEEWWDNNGGVNYRVKFRAVPDECQS